MSNRIRRVLPWIAAVASLVALIGLVITATRRQQMMADTGETRKSVEATLAQLQALHPLSPDDAAFRRAAEDATHAPYVAALWLFAPDGRIVYGSAQFARSGTAEEHATAETKRLLAALPEDTLTSEQRTALLAASTIQAEGEHNDVFRHLVREVRTPDRSLVGWIGVAYDVCPLIRTPGVAWIITLLVWLMSVVAYWLSLPLWVWLDARERGERAWVWAMFVLVGNLVALMAYILARSSGAENP